MEAYFEFAIFYFAAWGLLEGYAEAGYGGVMILVILFCSLV
jgi:hypothetical protein